LKNKKIIPISAINLVVVIVVTAVVALLTQNIMKELTIKDIRNVTRLTQTNINAEIKQELVEPVNTSIAMAQNTLLLDFMDQDTKETEARMAEYLMAIQKATGYESVFVVPHSTLSYYHPGGTDEKVDLKSDGAFWYKGRIDAKDAYGLGVNTEQLDHFALTVYINANLKDREGNFAGVAGVGKRITHFQAILTRYLEKQGVEAYLTDSKGLVLIHQDNKLIKKSNFYDLEKVTPAVIDIGKSRENPIERLVENRYYIVEYLPMLDWYLVVKKSSSEFTGLLNHYNIEVTIALVLGAMIILLVTNYAISAYKKQIVNLSNIDHLTEIPNRTLFDLTLQEAVQNVEKQDFCLALFDLDNLKAVNDSYGHDEGDQALMLIASIARGAFRDPDFVARVGGDEFAIIIYKPLERAKSKMEAFFAEIKENPELQKLECTISAGISSGDKLDTKTTIYKRADEGLYMSKSSGKDRIHVSYKSSRSQNG